MRCGFMVRPHHKRNAWPDRSLEPPNALARIGRRMTPDVDPLDLVDPARYARDGYPHALWTRLRAEAPVARIEPPGYEAFWAITKHADIVQVSKQPLRFSNAQGIMLRRADAPPMPPSEMVVMI